MIEIDLPERRHGAHLGQRLLRDGNRFVLRDLLSVITSPGGNVLARCIGGRVELVSWSPAQGYHVDSVDRDLRREAEIEFEAEDRDVEIKVRCVDGVPQRTVENED